MYVPPFVVFDVETAEGAEGSTEFYRANFRVTSAAFSWLDRNGEIKSDFVEGETAVLYSLERFVRARVPLVAHNAPFEMGVILCRFPEIAGEILWAADTMRLVQVYDNGGDRYALEAPLSLDDILDRELSNGGDDAEGGPVLGGGTEGHANYSGLGLVKSVRRILRRPDHKLEAYEWLRANGVRKGQEGANLGKLPKALLQKYNVGDTEETLRLYCFLTEYFAGIGYNWQTDHQLYMSSARKITEAKIKGVPVDRARLQEYRRELEQELEDIACLFRWKFAESIRKVERSRLLAEVQKRKTLRGRKSFLRRVRQEPGAAVRSFLFNVGSNKQLESLFCGVLGMEPKFRTDKGAPAFRSAVLSQWGEGGELLKRRRKRLLVLKQCESLIELTVYDGRWHNDLKVAGTATGRFSGGSH